MPLILRQIEVFILDGGVLFTVHLGAQQTGRARTRCALTIATHFCMWADVFKVYKYSDLKM